MKLLVLALVHIVGVYGGQLAYEAPYAAFGVPQPHPSIPGATTTYHGNGRFIGFPSGLVNPYAIQTPVVRNVVPVAPVTKTVLPAQPVLAQTQAIYHQQPLVTKTILPAQPIIHTHAVLPAQPIVPVAHIHAQPALLHKQIDIPTQAFKTSKYQVRRPAIQKQFYDIEERVIIRPAGSAVVELDPPHAKIHQGTILTPGISLLGAPIHQDQQITSPAPENQQQETQQQNQQQQQQQQQQENTEDTITVEAAPRSQTDISYARSGSIQSNIQTEIPQLTENQRLYIHQLLGDMTPQQILNNNNQFARQQTSTEGTTTEQQTTQEVSTTTQNFEQTTTESAKQESSNDQNQQNQPLFRQSNNINVRFNNAQEQIARNIGSNVVNQRFIDLFTARQGIAEIANQNSLQKSNNQVDNTFVRGRIISAENNINDLAKNANNNLPQENVNTRRIVVARPIETVQEVHVVEPVTKVHRVTVQQPALLKSTHLQLQHGFYH